MRILLDTHIYLWWLEDHPKLSTEARTLIGDATEVYVSSASIWEASIKAGIGKLDADVELQVSARHAAAVRGLADIHDDPFDRILIAQAICEPLRFLTHDGKLKGYSQLVKII